MRKYLNTLLSFIVGCFVLVAPAEAAFSPSAWDHTQTNTGNNTLTVSSATFQTINTTSGNVTLTLPSAAASNGKVFCFKRITSSSNTATVQRAGSDTIDGNTSITFGSVIGQVFAIQSDGTTSWKMILNSAGPDEGASGEVQQSNGPGTLNTWVTPSSGSGYTDIEEEGSGLTQRTTLNIIGHNLTAADDAGNSVTTLTLSDALDQLTQSQNTTASITLTETDPSVLRVSSAGGARVITLPDEGDAIGRYFTIIRAAGSNQISVAGNIEGAMSTYILGDSSGCSVTFFSDGSQWLPISTIPFEASTIGSSSLGKYYRGGGHSGGTETGPDWSTLTLPDTISSGKILIATSANVITGSTPSYPNAAGSAGNVIRSDGTDFISSGLSSLDLSNTNDIALRTSVNNWLADQIPSVASSTSLGSTTRPWRDLYLESQGGAGYIRLVTSTMTAGRTLNIPDADCTVVQGGSAVSNQFVTTISTAGVISRAQPSSSNLSDSSNIALRNSSNSFSTSQAPNAVNSVDLGATTAWFRYLYFGDDTSNYAVLNTQPLTGNRTVNVPDADSTTVQGSTAVSNQFMTGISPTTGAITRAQPSYSDLSGTPPAPAVSTFADGRLTLTTNVPVTTSDVTAATTIYYTPYRGNQISLYDGSAWDICTFSQLSASLSGLTAGRPYDVFVYDANADGVADTLEVLSWTNTTTRATALAYQNGVLVKSGTPARRYVGTIQILATGQCEDSAANRLVWNYYNRVLRPMQKTSSATTWTYSTRTWRQLNGGTGTVQVAFVTGVAEDSIDSTSSAFAFGNSNGAAAYCGIGIDSTSTNSAQSTGRITGNAGNSYFSTTAKYLGIPAVGSHVLYPLESGNTTTTTTFSGSGNDAFTIPGIYATYPM